MLSGIPPFWVEELWFAQVEGQFALARITDDEAKFAHVLSKIEPSQAKEIKDVITQPPQNDKYGAIKKALIQRLTDSQEQRIKQLLEHEELGERKPSQFLRYLTTLAGNAVSTELLRTLWLGRLPRHIQAILATRNEDRLEEVAEQEDKIYDISSKALVLATAAPKAATTADNPLEAQIAALTKQVATLTTQMAKNVKQHRSRSRTRSNSRSRRYRSRTPAEDALCFYHRRFGKRARKALLLHAGKRERRTLMAANGSATRPCRLYVTDRKTKERYLVDTGSDVSVYPHRYLTTRRHVEPYQLFAANGSPRTGR